MSVYVSGSRFPTGSKKIHNAIYLTENIESGRKDRGKRRLSDRAIAESRKTDCRDKSVRLNAA